MADKDDEIQQIIEALGRQKAEMQVMLGRLNGLHSLVATLLVHLPSEKAQAAAQHVAATLAQTESDLLALPLSDRTADEHLQVLRTGLALLEAAARRGGA